jgi:hypothetical protein
VGFEVEVGLGADCGGRLQAVAMGSCLLVQNRTFRGYWLRMVNEILGRSCPATAFGLGAVARSNAQLKSTNTRSQTTLDLPVSKN